MYQLVIVEDEALVREAIRNQINWSEYGFECAGVCEDGEEALEFIAGKRVDVVLTDIGMPFMDGLALTRELSRLYPTIKVVILTGYDNFSYAQQAVKMQAADYLLKPITSAELGLVLERLRAALDSDRHQKQEYAAMKQQADLSYAVLRESFLERLATSVMTVTERNDGCRTFHIQWAGDTIVALTVDIDEYEYRNPVPAEDRKLIFNTVDHIVQQLTGKREGCHIFRSKDDLITVLISSDDPDAMQDEALALAGQIREAAAAVLPVKLSIGIGHSCRLDEDTTATTSQAASEAYPTAVTALEYRYTEGGDSIIRLLDIEKRSRPAGTFVAAAWENEWTQLLRTGTLDEMEQWIDRFCSAIREHMPPVVQSRLAVQRIVQSMMFVLGEEEPEWLQYSGSPVQEIAALRYLADVQHWLKDSAMRSIMTIRNRLEHTRPPQVDEAIEYIGQHYKDPSLSLISACKHIALSPSYFSVMFKQYTGRTFIEYVTHVRLERAKELLGHTPLRSFEIAYEVGYADPHYFSSAFKKHCGVTPTEYREMMTAKKR